MALLIAALCLCVAATLVGEWRRLAAVGWVAKPLASSLFVVAALRHGLPGSLPARLIVAGLALSWIGDLLLVPRRGRLFAFGLGAFLLAHLAYAAAFVTLGARLPIAGLALLPVGGGIALFGRWLWPRLSATMRLAVPAYMAALSAMAALGIAATLATGRPLLAAAALAFCVSDLAVALYRFVAPRLATRAWGLPLYYAAQVLFALGL